MNVLNQVDDYAGWIAAVAAGLAGAGYLAKRARVGVRRLRELASKIDVLEGLAVYELQHNGGNSIKDRIAQIPGISKRLGEVEKTLAAHLATKTPPTTVNVTMEGAPSTTEVTQ